MSINKRKKRKGFTLIEVVAVMAILAILAAVLIPNVTGYITEARKFEVIEQARKVIIAAESINIKSPNAIDKTHKINTVIKNSGELLIEADVTLLDATNKTVGDCYNLVDTEKYIFTINDDKTLKSVEEITVTP